jgi:murein L,D-transpeptidase YcbB/YkuD
MRTLGVGKRGEDVKQLQRKLGITVDGIFGQGTKESVKQFQRNKGLQVDGIVGSQTWNALNGSGSGGASVPSSNGGFMDKIIGVAILYGIFQVLKKVF